jgi:hypothetical protein
MDQLPPVHVFGKVCIVLTSIYSAVYVSGITLDMLHTCIGVKVNKVCANLILECILTLNITKYFVDFNISILICKMYYVLRKDSSLSLSVYLIYNIRLKMTYIGIQHVAIYSQNIIVIFVNSCVDRNYRLICNFTSYVCSSLPNERVYYKLAFRRY